MSTPLNRRAALRLFARSTAQASAIAALPILAAAAASPAGDDAELLAMEAEIWRPRGIARGIYSERVEPLEDEFHTLMREAGYEAAWAFARAYGRDAAITEAAL